MERVFTGVWKHLHVSYDDFIRTTDPRRHKPAVQRMAQACYDAGDIYEGEYEGWYCVSCEAFKQEKDLVDGHCPVHPTIKPEWIREKNWFFRLSKYQQPLLESLRGAPVVHRAGGSPQRDPAAGGGGSRGHLGQPCRPVVGHAAAVRSAERGVRVVRRADQLRRGRGLRLGR